MELSEVPQQIWPQSGCSAVYWIQTDKQTNTQISTVYVKMYGVSPSEQFLDRPPPSINFVHDFSKFIIIYFLLF